MKLTLMTALIGAMLILGACKKSGCTDPFSDNYDPEAEVDDGSCSYGIDLIFYYNDARADFYDNSSYFSPIHVEVNGTDVGEANWWINTFNSEGPDCGTVGGTVNHRISLSSKLESVELRFVDQMGNVVETRNVYLALSDGTCQSILF